MIDQTILSAFPRRHHYHFAHIVLPDLGLRNPDRMLAALDGPGAVNFLRVLWQYLGEELPQEDRLDPQGLHCFVREHGPLTVAVITLPEPAALAEAYFTAFTFRRHPEVRDAAPLALAPRYFTLELGLSVFELRVLTVLAERSGAGHTNKGKGPEPEPEAFFQEVCRQAR